jgi:hypothetical protein
MTLVEFLKARVAEDEAAAYAPTKQMLAYDTLDDPGALARLRAEVDAKWQILALYDATNATDTTAADHQRAALGHVLRILGAVYSEHPDYNPTWAPDA